MTLAGLAQQAQIIRRDHQHPVENFRDSIAFFRGDGPQLYIVQQADQCLPIADRRVMPGLQLGLYSCHLLEQPPQIGDVTLNAAVEGIKDDPPAIALELDQEMARKIDAGRRPALRPGNVDIQYSQRHWQAFAAFDDPYQIGILWIVVGQRVALIIVFARNGIGQCARLAGNIAGDLAGQVGFDVADELGEVIAER